MNSSSIGYASYQQQYNSNSTTSFYQANDTFSIVLFFSIIALLFLSFVFYFWYTERHKIPINQRGDQAVGQQQEIYLLIDNISSQVKTTFKIPILQLSIVLYKRLIKKELTVDTVTEVVPVTTNQAIVTATGTTATAETVLPLTSHEHQRVYNSRLYHLFSLLFIISFFIALAILVGAVNSAATSSSLLLQAALFVLVLSINLYLITRQRCYYMERRKLFGNDDEHINAIYDTRFSDWDKSMWSNWVQITILIIEFFQLMTFPLRDLITVTSYEVATTEHQPQTSQLVSFILNAGGLMPDMRTPTWYTYSLWTAFATTLFSLLIGVIIHCINLKYPYKLSTRWVRWCIPVAVSAFFLAFLGVRDKIGN